MAIPSLHVEEMRAVEDWRWGSHTEQCQAVMDMMQEDGRENEETV